MTALNTTLQLRIAAIATSLAAHSIPNLVASYCGSGDDGSVDSVLVEGEEGYGEGSIDRITVQFEDEREVSLGDAMVELTDEVLNECGHGGYENDDGGDGRFIIRANGEWALDHRDAYTAYESSDYCGSVAPDLADQANREAAIEAAAETV